MEILIPGLILVALMVYVSTRIKRVAADAYEEEQIETDVFAVTKPDGFIIIQSQDPAVIFAAYSKEYGIEDADRFRQVAAELTFHKGRATEEVRDRIKSDGSRITDERQLAGGSLSVETEQARGGINLENEYHLTQNGDDTFEFCITALSETKAANQKAIDSMLSSFEIKK